MVVKRVLYLLHMHRIIVYMYTLILRYLVGIEPFFYLSLHVYSYFDFMSTKALVRLHLCIGLPESYQIYQARLRERLFKAEPGKLDIKRHEPGILYKSVYPLFHSSDNDVIFDICVDSASLATSLKVQRHHDLIKAHAVR